MRRIKLKTKAIIFDMDGVITNTMPDHFRAWKMIFKQAGIDVSPLDIYKREGQRGINSVVDIFRENNLSLDKTAAQKILKRKERLFKKIVKTRFIPGARRFLQLLHKNRFKLALVTGTSRHELHRILPKRLYKLFDVVVSGSDVRLGKPHPEPFLKAIQKLNIGKNDAVAIENAPFGILSAKGAGLKCLAIETSLPRTHLKNADFIFSSIRHLQEGTRFINNEKNKQNRKLRYNSRKFANTTVPDSHGH